MSSQVTNVAMPEHLKGSYSIQQQGDTVILSRHLSHRVVFALIATMFLSAGPILYMARPEAQFLILAVVCCLLDALFILNIFVQTSWRLAPGVLTLRSQAPWGTTDTDFSQAKLTGWHQGRSTKVYLVQPGKTINASSKEFALVMGADTTAQLADWVVSVTGLKTVR